MSRRPSLGRIALIAFLVHVAFGVWHTRFGPYAEVSRWASGHSLRMPEENPGAAVESVNAFLATLADPARGGGAEWVERYRAAQMWDFANALLLGLAGQLALLWLAWRTAPATPRLRLLAALPVLLAFVDLTENNAMIAALSKQPPSAPALLPQLTLLKFAAFGATFAAVVLLALAWIVFALQRRNARRAA